jgi:hypothetical protein
MTEDKKTGIFAQIFVAVVVALLIGGFDSSISAMS